jgi:hypothetical protein
VNGLTHDLSLGLVWGLVSGPRGTASAGILGNEINGDLLETVELEITIVKADERRTPATSVDSPDSGSGSSSVFRLVQHDTMPTPVLTPARVAADPRCSECRLTDYEFSGATRPGC